MLKPIINDIVDNKEYPKGCIIFCRTYDSTFEVFQMLVSELNKKDSLYIAGENIPKELIS